LKIADALEAGPKSAADIARETGTHEDSLYRVMRLLAATGVFAELPGKVFSLTPLSHLLLRSNPQGMRNTVRMMTQGEHWNAWGSLIDVVRGGGIATDIAEGCDIWEYFRKNPERAAIFDASMTDFTMHSNATVVSVFDFSQHKRVCAVVMAGVVVVVGGPVCVLGAQGEGEEQYVGSHWMAPWRKATKSFNC